MTKIKFTFWLILVLVIVGLVFFFKYNPLYASIEVVLAFIVGVCGEWLVERAYNKWVK